METVTLVMTLAVELVPLALTTLAVELVHELGLEVLLHGLLLIVVNLAILVGIELVHESSLAGLHSGLAILLGSGLRSRGNGNGGNGLRCRSRSGSGLRLSLLSEDRQSGYEGDDE